MAYGAFPDHPNPGELQGFLHTARPVNGVTSARIVRHLLAGCFTCRQRLRELGWDEPRLERLLTLRGSASEEGLPGAADYDYIPAFAAAERRLDAFFAKGRPTAAPADVLWAELALLPPEEQIRQVGSNRRYSSPELIHQLVEGSRAIRFEDPDRILHLAHLACLAAESCSQEETGSAERLADLRAQGWRQYANSLRVKGRLREAEGAFVRAQRYCKEGTGDPPLHARLLAQMISLRICQRRFEEAIDLADEAGRIYREIGQRNSLASTLVQKAVALLYSGFPASAIRTLNRALPLIEPDGDPHLLLAACHNLVRCYIDLEAPQQARSLYFEVRDLYREFHDTLILLRAGWQEGYLLRDLGHPGAAEAALLRAREGFCGQKLFYEAAIVSLDLAAVFVKLGDTQKLGEAVAEAVPIFRALGVDRETIASLLQLPQAARQERQALELIHRLSSTVEQIGSQPL